MKRLFRWLLAAWRALWLAGLRLLALPRRWLSLLLGPSRPAGPAPTEKPPAAAPAAERAQAREEVVFPATPTAPAAVEAREIDLEPAPAFRPEPPPARKSVAKPGQFIEAVFRNDAGQRDYKLYVPAGKPAGPLPLVVMLHGCKQDPDDFAVGTQMNRLADRQPMLVLYPAQARSANGFGCWNWFNRHDQQADAGEPAIIAGLIREVLAKHPVDRRRIYVAGLSAGGAMATILAHTHPELLAAAGVHSGLAYAAAQDMITALGVMKRGPGKRSAPQVKASAKAALAKAAVPLIVFHGDHDKTVHPLNGDDVVEQALASARAAKPHDHGHPTIKAGHVPGGHAYTRTMHTDRAGHVQVEHWLVQGAGHAWSGGDAQGSFTDPLGPDASAEMLRFFLERSKA